MTTTANKRGLRRVAEMKREKAAQRMPNVIVEMVNIYGDWKLNELRAEARRRGIDHSTLGKVAIQHALMADDKRVAEAPPQPRRETKPAQEAPAKAPSSNAEGQTAGTRSEAKAHAFGRQIEALGWTVTYRTEGEVTDVVATRGIEAIHQAWEGGVYANASATYTVGDRTVLTRNAGAARKLASRPTEAATEELSRVASNRAFRRNTPDAEPKAVRLPFDPATATEREIVDSIVGKAVKWINRFTNGEESAIVGSDPRRIRIEEQNGERVVLFCCQATGFRAFRLSALTAVGRGTRRSGRSREGVVQAVVEVAA